MPIDDGSSPAAGPPESLDADDCLRPRVVVIGGGFAGLTAVRSLRKAAVDITLVDRSNHHLFQPLLYQVATGALSPADIAAPLRSVLRDQPNVRVVMADVVSIDTPGNRVVLRDGELAYDKLLLAAGAGHSYFGNDSWEKHAPGLKDLNDALEIRSRVFAAFEAAERETDLERRKAWMTFVIVGGGPTGVELAGALAEIARKVLVKDFRCINPADACVMLVEAGSRVLGAYEEKLSAKAKAQLENLGVTVRLNCRVTALDEGGVDLGPERLPARTILWGAGVKASNLAETLGVPLDRAGRVLVDDTLHPAGLPNVFVLGDLAALEFKKARKDKPAQFVPGVAPAAIQQGRYVAKTLKRELQGKAPGRFRYRDKGMFAVVGRGRAVGRFGKVIRASGVVAWLAWLGIHIAFLVGFRNRAVVLFGWAYEYLTLKRGTRLITALPPHSKAAAATSAASGAGLHDGSAPPAGQSDAEAIQGPAAK